MQAGKTFIYVSRTQICFVNERIYTCINYKQPLVIFLGLTSGDHNSVFFLFLFFFWGGVEALRTCPMVFRHAP